MACHPDLHKCGRTGRKCECLHLSPACVRVFFVCSAEWATGAQWHFPQVALEESSGCSAISSFCPWASNMHNAPGEQQKALVIDDKHARHAAQLHGSVHHPDIIAGVVRGDVGGAQYLECGFQKTMQGRAQRLHGAKAIFTRHAHFASGGFVWSFHAAPCCFPFHSA